jgi:hypothetical protein
MPCNVCSAWPTWADLSECEKPNCPWTLDMSLPIPPLPKSLRDAPLHQAIAPPEPVRPQPPVRGPLPAVINLEEPPVHSHASIMAKTMEAESVAEPVAKAFVATPTPPTPPTPIQPKAVVAKPVAPKAPPKPRFSTRKIAEDFENIMKHAASTNWSGKFGPSCQVETKLKWENRDCRELYMAVKRDLHDQPFSVGKRTLYYYVGAIGNWGKAGFRISGHTKPKSKIKASETHGVLHIEN